MFTVKEQIQLNDLFMFLIFTLYTLLGMVAAAEGQGRELHLSSEVYQHRRGNQLKKALYPDPSEEEIYIKYRSSFCNITTLSHINLP